MVETLTLHEGVGLMMIRSCARGTRHRRQDAACATSTTTPWKGSTRSRRTASTPIDGLRRVDGMEHCGDIVAISLLDPETDEVAAFEELIGSHGGLGGPQTHPFILHPAEWTIDEPIVGAEAVYRQIRRWLEANGIPLGKQPAPVPPAAEETAA